MPNHSPNFCIPLYVGHLYSARIAPVSDEPLRQYGLALMKTLHSVRFGLLVLVVLLAALPSTAQTKDEKKAEAQLRVVHGLVGDKDENPIPSSVVYLVNGKTKAVKTSFADDKGQYRFSGLDPNVDYEIHAEHEDLTSSTRTVSSFDSRRDIEVNLKLTRKKKD
jgi:hypothetical protein